MQIRLEDTPQAKDTNIAKLVAVADTGAADGAELPISGPGGGHAADVAGNVPHVHRTRPGGVAKRAANGDGTDGRQRGVGAVEVGEAIDVEFAPQIFRDIRRALDGSKAFGADDIVAGGAGKQRVEREAS